MHSIEYVSLAELNRHKHPENPKDHSIPDLIDAFQRFGFAAPILQDDRTSYIAAGHGRLNALLTMRGTHLEAPGGIEVADDDWLAPVVHGWASADDDELLAYVIADNRQNELGGWKAEGLATFMARMEKKPAGLKGIGYTSNDLAMMIARMKARGAAEADTREPTRIELPENPITVKGDVWQVGQHRIMCGDCRDPGDVDVLLGGALVNLAITSPPYADRRKYDETTEFRPIHPDDYVEWFRLVTEQVARVLVDDGSWLVNIKPSAADLDTDLYVHDLVAAHVREWGWHFATEFCWERSGVPKGPVLRLKNQFEPVYQFVRNRWKFYPEHVRRITENPIHNVGPGGGNTAWDNRQGVGGVIDPKQRTGRRGAQHQSDESTQGTYTEWRVGDDADGWAYPGNRLPPMAATHEATGHPAAFPVGLPEFFVQLMTMPGETVFDPFVGSGATVLAAHHQGRIAYGMELSPAYVDVALARWQRHTDEKPIRIGDGPHDFSEIPAEQVVSPA